VVGTVARTAVVAGTASAVVNSGNQKREAQAQTAAKAAAFDDAQRQAELDAAVQQAVAAQTPAAAPPPPPAAAPAAAGPSMLDQLKELAALKEAGVLDEAEFAAAKANILAG
jgi:sugar phosphate isomerase/epimerase